MNNESYSAYLFIFQKNLYFCCYFLTHFLRICNKEFNLVIVINSLVNILVYKLKINKRYF